MNADITLPIYATFKGAKNRESIFTRREVGVTKNR